MSCVRFRTLYKSEVELTAHDALQTEYFGAREVAKGIFSVSGLDERMYDDERLEDDLRAGQSNSSKALRKDPRLSSGLSGESEASDRRLAASHLD